MIVSCKTFISILTILFFTPILSVASDKYSLGVFPYNSARQIISIYGPVTQDLGKKAQANISLKTASNFYKFTKNLEAEIYDLALIQPFDYPNAIDKFNYTPIARLDAPLVAFYIVLEDSDIQSLEDLRGKVIAFPPPPAAISHLAKAELNSLGISPEKDVKIQYQKNHDSCLHEVLIHRASACPTDFSNIKKMGENRKNKFRVLKQTKELPHILFVGHKRVPQNILNKLKKQIISWKNNKNGKSILKKMGMPGFVSVKDSDYKVMYSLQKKQITPKRSSNSKDLSFGVFPYIPPKELAKLLAPMPKAFSRALNDKVVHFRSATSYDQFNQNITQGAYDIIFTQPFDYKSAIEYGYTPIAQSSETISAHIYVNKKSNIQTLTELKGKTIASPPRHAAVSRLFNKKIRQAGFWPGQDLIIEYKQSHLSCLKQLKYQKASACISAPGGLLAVSPGLSKNIRLLDKSQEIPGLIFMVKNQMDKKSQTILKNTIINWHKTPSGKELLNNTKLQHFIDVNKAQYDKLQLE